MALSKLSEVCKRCPFVDACDDKCMEAVGALELPQQPICDAVANAATIDIYEAVPESVLREVVNSIDINGNRTLRYKDELEKELYKHLYEGLMLKPLA